MVKQLQHGGCGAKEGGCGGKGTRLDFTESLFTVHRHLFT